MGELPIMKQKHVLYVMTQVLDKLFEFSLMIE